jgi:hypothetical protein
LKGVNLKIPDKNKKILIILSVVFVVIIAVCAPFIYFSITPCACIPATFIPLEYGKTIDTSEYKVVLINFGAHSGRIHSIFEITFTNTTTELSPIEVCANNEIIEFKYVVEPGLNYTFIFVMDNSFTEGGSYTLNIHYQTRNSCDRWWNGYTDMALEFVY